MNPNIFTCKRFSGFTVNKLIPTFGAIKLAKIYKFTKTTLTKNMLTQKCLQKICSQKVGLQKIHIQKIRSQKIHLQKYAYTKVLTKIRSLFALSFLLLPSHLKINRCPHPGQVAFDKQVGKVSQTNCFYELIKEFGTPHKKDVHNHGALT